MDIKDASNMPNWVLTDEQRAPNYITPTSSRIIFTFDQLLRFWNLYAYNIIVFNVHGQLCIGARGYLTISIRDACGSVVEGSTIYSRGTLTCVFEKNTSSTRYCLSSGSTQEYILK